ncbi:uncharacterized protein LOC105439579 [Strongylocentrotus purpuratus]|uniref:Uncharacterized protein n=1 Tax=Strongylocentrotus purpuratus TaxID=7668 RepID=A0A7M7NAF5_STRPU|nr:uncharacterized protein LOC105439579 [Strongylocentrotus purpuratus]
MIIAIGVSAAAGFILLISLGLMYFYGVLCCVKQKKDHGKHNQPEGQMVDLGEYTEIAPVPPSHASKSTTSDYMDLKPIPRTNTDTTTSYYMDLKPIPRTNTDTTTSDYMDLKHIPRTNTDTTTSYYMDLKPVPRTNNDTPTSNYMDMKPISPADNDEYISPSATRKCPEAVYVNRDMTDESALQNDPDNQDCVSPI